MARWLKAHKHCSCRGPKNDAQLPVISSLGRSGTSSLCGHRNSLSPLRCQCLPLQQQQLCSYVITCRQETFHCPLCGLCTFNSARQAQLTRHSSPTIFVFLPLVSLASFSSLPLLSLALSVCLALVPTPTCLSLSPSPNKTLALPGARGVLAQWHILAGPAKRYLLSRYFLFIYSFNR